MDLNDDIISFTPYPVADYRLNLIANLINDVITFKGYIKVGLWSVMAEWNLIDILLLRIILLISYDCH